MAVSATARPDVGRLARALATVVAAVGVALSALLLAAPTASGSTTTPAGSVVRSAPGSLHQVGSVVRGTEVGAVTRSEAQQLVRVGAGAATPASGVARHVPQIVFVGLTADPGDQARGRNVAGVLGRAPPVRSAPCVH